MLESPGHRQQPSVILLKLRKGLWNLSFLLVPDPGLQAVSVLLSCMGGCLHPRPLSLLIASGAHAARLTPQQNPTGPSPGPAKPVSNDGHSVL